MTTGISARLPRLRWGQANTWWGNVLKRTFLPWVGYFHFQPPPRPPHCTISPSLALRLSLWQPWRGFFFFSVEVGGVAWANSNSLTFLWEVSRISDTHGLVGLAGQRLRRRSSATLQWSCSRPPPAATADSIPTFITAEKPHTHPRRPECQRSWHCRKGQNV